MMAVMSRKITKEEFSNYKSSNTVRFVVICKGKKQTLKEIINFIFKLCD